MSRTTPAAPGHRRAEPPRRRSRTGLMLTVGTLALGLVVGGVTGGWLGHSSRDEEVATLRSDAAAQRAAARDAQRVAEDQVERAADAGGDSYAATALAKHSAAGAQRAVARTREAERKAAACRAAMRTEMRNVATLLDILDRDDPTYTVERLKDVDADAGGIRRCVGAALVREPEPAHPEQPTEPDDPDDPTTATVLARTAKP